MKINDAYERFIEMMFYERNVSIQTIDCYKEDLKLFFENTQLNDANDLTLKDIENFIKILSSQGKAISTIIRRVGTIRQFYLFLQKEGVITDGSAIIDMPKKRESLPTVLTFEEVEALLEQPNTKKR